jgi:hypothetical protein
MITQGTDGITEDLQIGTSNGKVYDAHQEQLYLAATIGAIFDAEVEVVVFTTPVHVPGMELLGLFSFGNNQGGVARSTNNGANFTMVNEGLPNPAPVSAMAVSDLDTMGTAFVGLYQNIIDGAKIFKRSIPSVGVSTISSEVPNGFSLSQNYPNPFNPVTKIKFALPKSSNVKIVIYNSLGKEIQTIVNKYLNAGTYEADWNAASFSSGAYFYTITAGEFRDTRKMLLVK